MAGGTLILAGADKKLFIGLTGGPGVGKSEVAKIMRDYGARVIFADQIGHELLANNEGIKRKLVKLLDPKILTDDGSVDRRAIGRMVFGNPDKMAEFNSIIHPPLLRKLKQKMRHNTGDKRSNLVVVDAALIFEWGIANWFDFILVVHATRDLRIKRMTRTGLSKAQAIKRIASQLPQRDKVALADYVIANNSSLRILRGRVRKLIASLKAID